MEISEAANKYLSYVLAYTDPGGSDGNLLTNYVDDGFNRLNPQPDPPYAADDGGLKEYSQKELEERLEKFLLHLADKGKIRYNKKITPESDEVLDLEQLLSPTFHG